MMFTDIAVKPMLAYQEELRSAIRQLKYDPNFIPVSPFPVGVIEIGKGKVRCAYCLRLYPSIPEKNCGSCGAADWIEPLRYSDGGVEVEYWEKP